MALPLSRNKTCTPADPVDSDLDNDLQDCVIGGKHGWLWRALPAPMWEPKAGGNASLGALEWTFGAATLMHCALDLNVNTVIRELRVAFIGSVGNVHIRLLKRSLTADVAVVTTLLRTIATAAQFYDESIVDFDPGVGGNQTLTIEAGFQYAIEVELTNAAHKLRGARIEHSLQ